MMPVRELVMHSIGKSASTTNLLPQLDGYKCDRFGLPKTPQVMKW